MEVISSHSHPAAQAPCKQAEQALRINRSRVYHINCALESEKAILRPKELSLVLGWEISRLSHQITRMEKSGLVKREVDKNDSRRYQIKISALGKQIIQKAFPLQEQEVKHCFGDVLSDHQLHSLIEISEAICKHLDEKHAD